MTTLEKLDFLRKYYTSEAIERMNLTDEVNIESAYIAHQLYALEVEIGNTLNEERRQELRGEAQLLIKEMKELES